MLEAALSVAPETETLVLAGPPQMLRGELRLRNESDAKAKIRSLAVRGRGESGSAFAAANVQLAARLYPGEQANVPMQLALNSETPPGVYEMEMDVGGRTVPIRAHVTEHVDLRIEPAEVTLLAGGNRPLERTFVVTNSGNVPLPLGERCEAPMFDSVDFISALREALRKTVGKELKPRLESMMDEMGHMQVGALIVHRDKTTVRPGERLSMTARFELPEDTKPSRHYRAALQLYNATLAIDIYTMDKAGQKRAAAKKGSSS
ncbi:MAG TPA: hypothetical protein VF551_02490 [Chthoniobacterales bacterium]